MERIEWLPDELQYNLDPNAIIDFLNFFSPRVIHPKQKKYALEEWGKLRGVDITPEMLDRLEVKEQI